ncbi:DJ-1 [Asbolus verrucosus]|uniref:DJ-1 n=1 Tax=Asbolus verrucosus TaxID=1661398 RepID=A0A482WBH9_ASBVE|nr:DJ-1 [Asbolus verrucosus]
MAKRALVFLAPGAEEMEAVISIDVLRRGGIDVTVAGLPDSNLVACSRGVNIKPDISISEASSKGPFDVVVLPGGLGGSKALSESKEVGQLIKDQEKAGRWTAAICAAPTALKAHGTYVGKNLTSYPAMEAQLAEGGQYNYKQDAVVVDGNLITSRGPGTAFDFALTIVDKLNGKEKASEVAKAMLLSY